MVFMAGKHIDNINGFSSEFLTTLKLITDGYSWLKWALTNPSLSVYYAQNEQDLLMKIQSGLHETLLLRSKAFTVHLEKVLSFDDADLDLMVELFQSGNANAASVTALSKRYQLVSNKQLQSLGNFFTSYNQTNAPIFQGIGFEEQLKLYKFQKALKTGEVTNEAITFAISKSATCAEFVHYARFYMNCVNHQLNDQADSAARPELINDIYNQLDEVCFSLIYVPQVGAFDSTQELADHLKDFIATSKFIGYQMKASAMDSLSKNVPISGASDSQLRTNIEHFMTFVKQEVAKGVFEPGTLSQDGLTQPFICTSDNYQTIIEVDDSSNVCLSPESQSIK